MVRRLKDETEEPATVAELAEELELDKSAVRRRVKAAVDYINNLEDKRGKPARLVPGTSLPDDIEVLPDPAKLAPDVNPGSKASVQEGINTNFFSQPGSEVGKKNFVDTPSGNGASLPHSEREVFTI